MLILVAQICQTQQKFEAYAEQVHKNFAQEKQYDEMVEAVCGAAGISLEIQEPDVVEFD